MLLHASHAAQHDHQRILIQTVEADVVILAVSMGQRLQPEDELWVAFGTAAHEASAGLGPEKARALPMFHALIGRNTVSSFADHSFIG